MERSGRIGLVESGEEASASRINRLSEENLRIYDAACPKVDGLCEQYPTTVDESCVQSDGYFQVNLIREERAREAERETYRQIYGDVDHLSDADFSPHDTDIALRRKASQDALRLYTGSIASLSTPMDRFLAMSPSQDTHPWLAKNLMAESGVPSGDLEGLDVRRLASELVSGEAGPHESGEASAGSPRPSSDTLSISRFMESKERREAGKARNWQKVRMRRQRRSTTDKTKRPRSAPQSPPK